MFSMAAGLKISTFLALVDRFLAESFFVLFVAGLALLDFGFLVPEGCKIICYWCWSKRIIICICLKMNDSSRRISQLICILLTMPNNVCNNENKWLTIFQVYSCLPRWTRYEKLQGRTFLLQKQDWCSKPQPLVWDFFCSVSMYTVS